MSRRAWLGACVAGAAIGSAAVAAWSARLPWSESLITVVVVASLVAGAAFGSLDEGR